MFSAVFLACLVGFAYGLPALTPDGRIVGGDPIDISEVPWQISMVYFGSHRCGGAIISADTIMTAAHCLDGVYTSGLQVRAGSSDQTSGGQLVRVSSYTQHSGWNPVTMDYDYAIMKLSSKLTLGPKVQIISLVASGESVNVGSSVLVSGWGALSEGGPSPLKLQAVVVPAISQSQCESNYAVYKADITARMFCAGYSQGGKDACQGDSGGPVVIGGKLAGVVSWGIGCARPSVPGVYSRLAAVRPWIDSFL